MTANWIASMWRPAAIQTCPHERCVTTGRVIAEVCGLEAVVSANLKDLNYGDGQWKTYDGVKGQWPCLYERWRSLPHLMRFPSLQNIVLRSADAFRVAVESFPNEIIVLVGHDSVNRALLLQLLDEPLSAYWRLAQDPCCINGIEYERGEITVKLIKDAAISDGRAQPSSPARASFVRFFCFCSTSWAGWASRRLVHAVREGLAAERI